MSIRIITLAILTGLLLSISACGDDETTTPPEEPSTLDVYFGLSVDGASIQLSPSAQTYTNPAGTKYGIKVVRFILSDIRLHDDEGGSTLVKSVHYFDITDPTTQIIHVSDLRHANYTSVSFTFGLNASRNVRNQYPAIPLIMVWPESYGADLGYHYMQIEGNYELTPGGATGGYTTHTGGRHLDGTNASYPGVVDAAAHHFHFPVSASFTPAHIHEGGHGELDLNIDLNGWYLDHTPLDGTDTQYDFNALPSQTIMGDLDAQGKLQTNGPGCFSATLVTEGGHDH